MVLLDKFLSFLRHLFHYTDDKIKEVGLRQRGADDLPIIEAGISNAVKLLGNRAKYNNERSVITVDCQNVSDSIAFYYQLADRSLKTVVVRGHDESLIMRSVGGRNSYIELSTRQRIKNIIATIRIIQEGKIVKIIHFRKHSTK